MISAAKVATAAPGTPIANVKIRIGSNTALKTLANALTLTGVLVSRIPWMRKMTNKIHGQNHQLPSKSIIQIQYCHRNLPRKAENPTSDTKDGRNAKDRMSRYGLAYCSAGAPSDKTELRARSGFRNMRGVPIMAMKNPTNKAWQIASLVPFLFPLACCFETNVAVTADHFGKKKKELIVSKHDPFVIFACLTNHNLVCSPLGRKDVNQNAELKT